MTSRIDGDAGQQHDEPVDADPHAPRRREPVLERADVVGVDSLGLGVAPFLERGLRLETPQLLDRVVQLAERVRELAAGNDQLEAFGERGVVAVRARERRDLERVVAHERRRLDARPRSSSRRSRARACLRPSIPPTGRRTASQTAPQLLDRLRRVHVDAGVLLHEVDQRAPPRTAASRSIVRPSHSTCVVADRRARGVGDQLLGEAHHVGVVGERLVQLEHRELGIVARGEAFVAEHTSDLEYPVETADDQPLQIQLGRDAEREARRRARCGAS